MVKNNIAEQLNQIMKREIEKAKVVAENAGEIAAKDTAQYLRDNSPKRTGDYAQGFTDAKIDGVWTTYNKTHGSLVHIIENGHAKVNGGRVSGQPHMKPAAIRAVKKYREEIMRGLSK